MEKRFQALRIIGTIFKVLAWIILALGIMLGVGTLLVGLAGGLAAAGARGDTSWLLPGIAGSFLGLFPGILIILVSGLYFLVWYGTGEAIYLALAIEENTRATAQYLLHLKISEPPHPQPEAPKPDLG